MKKVFWPVGIGAALLFAVANLLPVVQRAIRPNVEADVREGGRYRIEVHEDDGTVDGFTGEYLALEPGERVAFTFTHHSRTPADRISDETVTVVFREVGPGRTEVRITNA